MTRTVKRYRTVYFFSLLMLSISGSTQVIRAQGLTNQTTIFIPTGLEIHLPGDFVNDNFIQNQGSFFVTGNWKNNAVYQGLGEIILEGSGPQRFFNNKNAVHILIIDGIGVKSMEDKVPVASRLDLNLGIVMVTDVDTLLLSNGSTVSGGSSRSYVEGAFTHEGAGYKFFPIGKNGGYFPVEMLNITGISPITEIEVFDGVPAITLPSPASVLSNVYWQRKSISGTFVSSPLSLGYPIAQGYANRHVIDIFQGDVSNLFSPVGNTTVEPGGDISKVTADNTATGTRFVLGESVPADGIPGAFYFSTSLSPSAVDPDNRAVKIFGNQLSEENFQFIVYNRWGLAVYESRSLTEMIARGWDGRHQHNGEQLPSGAYPFFFRAVKKSGGVVEQKGVISLVR